MSRKDNFVQEAIPGIPEMTPVAVRKPAGVAKKPAEGSVEQLAMYKTPQEIMSEYNPLKGDMHGFESVSDTWSRKAREGRTGLSGNSRNEAFSESHPDTLANSIKREGVQNPVTLQTKDLTFGMRPEVFGGHHRIATANKINPNMLVPVSYAESFSGASTNQRRQGDDPRFPVEAKTVQSTESSSSKKTSSSIK